LWEDPAIVAGQVGVRSDGTAGESIGEQARIAFENIDRVLAESTLKTDDIASLRIYLTLHDHIEFFTETAKSCLGEHRPAATLLIVVTLAHPTLDVQIEVIAVGSAFSWHSARLCIQ